MLDLNHILLFLAGISPLAVLARSLRQGARYRSWQVAALAVLLITAATFFLAPNRAGFVGGGVWLLFLFFPIAGSRKVALLQAEERYGSARRLAGLLRWLHPTAELRAEHAILRALEQARGGERTEALQILDTVAPDKTRAGRRAAAIRLSVREDWENLLAWSRAHVPPAGVGEDPTLLPLYLRALGELGLRDELVLQFAGRVPSLLASPLHQPLLGFSMLLLFVYCGRTDAVKNLLATQLNRLTSEAKAFWVQKSEVNAQRPLPLQPVHQATVFRFERNLSQPRRTPFAPSARFTPAVVVIIALNIAAFVLEGFFGGSQNPIALQRLGALEPASVIVLGQYWRLVAALFLHYGALHLAMNAYALFVLGPSLEANIGTFRFVICYLLSGIGSSLGVVALWRLGITHADLLVGASGAVMGIVGAWAGLLIGRRHSPMAQRQLLQIALIVAIQSAFDFSTPQVSMSAHLSGFISGAAIGLILAPRPKPDPT